MQYMSVYIKFDVSFGRSKAMKMTQGECDAKMFCLRLSLAAELILFLILSFFLVIFIFFSKFKLTCLLDFNERRFIMTKIVC